MKRHVLFIAAVFVFAPVDELHAQLPTVTPANRPRPVFTVEDFKAQTPRSKEGAFLMEVPQILHTANSPEVQAVLAGQTIETTGQVARDAAVNDGRHFRISRTQLHCCAEHASECSVLLEFAEPPSALKDGTWVTTTGVVIYKRDGAKTIVVIRVSSIKETPKPAVTLLQ